MREKKKYSAVLAGAAASMLLTTQNVIAEDVNNSTENMGTQTPDASETTAEAAVFEAPEVVDDQTTSHSITINVKAGLQYSISSEQDKPDKEWNAIVTEDGEYTFSDLDADQEYYIQAKKADGTVSEVLDVKTPAEETAAPSEEAVSVNQIAVAESQIAESKVAETEKAAEPKVTPAGHEYADAAGWHYVDGNGHVITGFYTLPYGKKVYYDANGVMAHGQKLIDGYWYYFDEFDGAMQTGWKYIPYQNKTVYYDADGKMLKGDQIIDGKEYYFDSYYGARTYGIVDLGKEGKVCLTAQGRVKNQEKLINDSWYYFDKEGHMVTGFYTLPYGKKVYYDADGAMAHGQKLIDGYWYYFAEFDGAMQTGWKYIPYQNKTVYYDADGKMLKGDQIIDGKEYYFDSYYGARTYGWVESENAYYTSEGKKYSNLSGQQAFDGHWYYFDETSHKPVTGFKYIANQNKTVYYNEKGEMQYGEKALNGHWYYFNPVTGAMATGFVYLPNGNKTVYYNSNGQMLYGEQYVNGIGYFFDPVTGAMRAGGWLRYGNKWYHLRDDGVMDANQYNAPQLISQPGYYISPMKAGNLNTPSERIEAMIARAYEYSGSVWRACYSQWPGGYADCSGLVMQCLLAAGFDPSPATPAHHAQRQNEYDSRTLYYQTPMMHISVNDLQRGDIVWYARGGTIIHVAIYLGNGQVIDSWPPRVTTHSLYWSGYGSYIIGAARPFH